MKKGHYFPSSAGFKGSTGKVRQVRAYQQAVPKIKRAMGEGPISDADVRLMERAIPLQKARGGMVGAVGAHVLGRPSSSPKAPPVLSSSPKTPPTGIKAPPRVAPAVRRPPGLPTGRSAMYAKGGYVTETIGDQGNSATHRGNPPITQFDRQHGGRGPLAPGFNKGGFNRTPKVGK